MENTMFWAIAAGVLVAVEMITGTFYLLMLALGAAAGGLAAYFGAGLSWQIATGSIIGVATTAMWHLYRLRHAGALVPAQSNADVLIDIGAEITVPTDVVAGQGRVSYRGSDWDARLANGQPLTAGIYTITAIERNQLLLARR